MIEQGILNVLQASQTLCHRLRPLIAGAALALLFASPLVSAQVTLRNVVTGDLIDLSEAQEEGSDTEAVKQFLQTGRNIYNNDAACLKEGESLFLTACSACHGHHAEGKIGPSLTDDYVTYPEGWTEEGFFSIIFGGARASMGPQYLALTMDEMLLVMAWVRHIYHGDVSLAEWMTADEKKAYTPNHEAKAPEVPAGASCNR